MHYIGLDVHKRTMSYCVKDVDGRIHRQEQLAIKEQLVQEQLKIADDAAKAQIAAQQAHLEQQRVPYELKKRQLDALHLERA